MQPEIRQLIPAPGWRAFTIAVNGDEISFDERPLLAWAVTEHGAVIPLAWDEEISVHDPLEDAREMVNAAATLLAPGETATDSLKEELEKCVCAKLKTVKQ